jgi:hypothetical protein
MVLDLVLISFEFDTNWFCCREEYLLSTDMVGSTSGCSKQLDHCWVHCAPQLSLGPFKRALCSSAKAITCLIEAPLISIVFNHAEPKIYAQPELGIDKVYGRRIYPVCISFV